MVTRRGHEERQAQWFVGVTFMVTRRGWGRDPIPYCEQHARAAHPTHRLPSKPSNICLTIVTLSRSEGSLAQTLSIDELSYDFLQLVLNSRFQVNQ
jgi:hypothetical protein